MNKERREQELVIQRITNALLDEHKVAEDVFKPKEGESMESALNRHLGYSIKVEGKEYKVVYSQLGVSEKFKEKSEAEGYVVNATAGRSLKIGEKMYSVEDVRMYCKDIDNTPKELPIKLAKRISLGDIESDVKKYIGKRFNKLTDDEKVDLLWEYGLNVKPDVDGSSKYYVIRCIHRNRQNKPVKGLCIVASERTDKEWLMSPMASFEAKTFSTDGELCKDIYRMSRY